MITHHLSRRVTRIEGRCGAAIRLSAWNSPRNRASGYFRSYVPRFEAEDERRGDEELSRQQR
jgi:hypothetical protein